MGLETRMLPTSYTMKGHACIMYNVYEVANYKLELGFALHVFIITISTIYMKLALARLIKCEVARLPRSQVSTQML